MGERMKFGRPWNVEGIRPRARETARAAARRSGMTVGEWLNSVIIEQAAEEGIRPLHAGIGDPDPDRADEELAAINNRLADLTRQLDRIERGGAGALLSRERAERSAERPNERSGESTPRQLAEAIARCKVSVAPACRLRFLSQRQPVLSHNSPHLMAISQLSQRRPRSNSLPAVPRISPVSNNTCIGLAIRSTH